MSPDTIHYKGYFQLAEQVFRVADIYEKLGKPLG
jgi:tRNA isopentenyl-2-thiomethyl-A-37 hydroxylase MiaE